MGKHGKCCGAQSHRRRERAQPPGERAQQQPQTPLRGRRGRAALLPDPDPSHPPRSVFRLAPRSFHVKLRPRPHPPAPPRPRNPTWGRAPAAAARPGTPRDSRPPPGESPAANGAAVGEVGKGGTEGRKNLRRPPRTGPSPLWSGRRAAAPAPRCRPDSRGAQRATYRGHAASLAASAPRQQRGGERRTPALCQAGRAGAEGGRERGEGRGPGGGRATSCCPRPAPRELTRPAELTFPASSPAGRAGSLAPLLTGGEGEGTRTATRQGGGARGGAAASTYFRRNAGDPAEGPGASLRRPRPGHDPPGCGPSACCPSSPPLAWSAAARLPR